MKIVLNLLTQPILINVLYKVRFHYINNLLKR